MNNVSEKKWILLRAGINVICSFLIFFVFRNVFWNIFGSDVIEYENWFGDIENPIQYTFGSGSAMIVLNFVLMAVFLVLNIICYRRNHGLKTVVWLAAVVHVVNFLIWTGVILWERIFSILW